MLKEWFGKKKESPRQLKSVNDLIVDDYIELKPRSCLPDCLQGATLAITGLASYEYSGTIAVEFEATLTNGEVVYLSPERDDGELEICFSIKIPRKTVLTLFNENDFAQLWEDEFPTLEANLADINGLEGWLTEAYSQSVKYGVAYYHQKDLRRQRPSQFTDDSSEELQYHECEGGEEGEYGINVEVWADGSTDVYLTVTCPAEVVQEYYPSGG